jgi:hypothetical protein
MTGRKTEHGIMAQNILVMFASTAIGNIQHVVSYRYLIKFGPPVKELLAVYSMIKNSTSRFYRALTMVYNTELLGFRTLSIVRIPIN